jgi:hypothetical protein
MILNGPPHAMRPILEAARIILHRSWSATQLNLFAQLYASRPPGARFVVIQAGQKGDPDLQPGMWRMSRDNRNQ